MEFETRRSIAQISNNPSPRWGWGKDFLYSAPSRPALGLLYSGYQGSFPGVKRPDLGDDNPLRPL